MDVFVIELKKYYDILIVLTQSVRTLENDATRLSEELLHANNLIQAAQTELQQIKLYMNQKPTCLASIAESQAILQQELPNLKQKVNGIKFISYDGSLLWKITNVSSTVADAQSETETSIYSPIFYSSLIGYKMRAKLYLNGDGEARRTHVSIFFLLMRSDHDLILKWPFSHKSRLDDIVSDLRLAHPISEFLGYSNNINFSALKREEHNHLPSLIILFKTIQLWQQENKKF
ncbi:unnamed protein product [Didymodactylos carnosus]|uniref:MATH domain-containing protein n=1 Tax=Didymodactylos carnosus TaxID=1234261 RepID=A0A814ZWU5_9BILA|nr:unnamed protein product [Didymodactylos carnosus]CAF4017219.1 unnamed protein product [Didymodactylos carnosus]